MKAPRYTSIIKKLPCAMPFVSADTIARENTREFRARLGANENGFGPSPKAVKAMSECAQNHVWKYGDEFSHDLRAALAAHCGVSEHNITVGEGIDGLQGLLVRLLCGPDTQLLTSRGAYPTVNYHVMGNGGSIEKVPYKDGFEDLDALARAAQELRPSMVYVANPDNPMGSFHTGDAINDFLDQLPDGCLLCLDEAYCEFAPKNALPIIDPNDPRVIRFRTFSKAYALAGARVGYAIAAPELIQSFDKIRNHFGVNIIGQAGALAALGDTDYLAVILTKTDRAKSRIGQIAKNCGLAPLPSATNFVTLDTGRDGAFSAAVVKSCEDMGVFIRRPFAAPENRCLRISVGPDAALDVLAGVLPKALKIADNESR